MEKLAELGVTPGPHFKRLKDGETVEVDGKVLHPHDFLGAEQKGRIVTILGDTRTCQAAVELARDADLLIHEATFSEGEGSLAYDYFHSTTIDAATTAKEAGVTKLCLTHISSRYDHRTIIPFTEEATNIFPETIYR